MKAHIIRPKVDPNVLYDECLQAYEEYKTFINYSDMPKFTLKFDDQLIKEHTHAITNYCNGLYTICISPALTTLQEDIRKSVYFHEFTHIKDTMTAIQFFENPNLANNRIKVYTEFHASRIETMVLLKFKNSSQANIVHSNDIIIYPIDQKVMTVDKFLWNKYIHERANIKDNIDKIDSTDNYITKIKLFGKALQFALYYLGSLDLCTQNCDNSLDNYRKFIPFTEIFGDKFAEYYNELKNSREISSQKLKVLNDKELDMIRERGLIPMV